MSVITTLESKDDGGNKDDVGNKDNKENKILPSNPGTKCANCGHDVMAYHHPLSSGSLMFHDNGGIFSRTCSGCKCKDPKAAETSVENGGKNT